MRKEFGVGLLAFGLALTLKQFIVVPEFIMGGLMGFSICFEILGVLPEKTYLKLKQIKRSLFRRR